MNRRILFFPIAFILVAIILAFAPTLIGMQQAQDQQNAQIMATAPAPILGTGTQALAHTDAYIRPTTMASTVPKDADRRVGFRGGTAYQLTMVANSLTFTMTAPKGLAAGHRAGTHLRL